MKNILVKATLVALFGISLGANAQAQTQNPHLFQPVFSIKFAQETSAFNRGYVEGNHRRGHQTINPIDRRLSDQARTVQKRKKINISNPQKGSFFKRP